MGIFASAFKTVVIFFLFSAIISPLMGENGFTKGREIEPLPPELKALAEFTTIPSEFLAKVREIIVPGSTLILSDLPASSQTRSEQDFRILTTESGEPQSKPERDQVIEAK